MSFKARPTASSLPTSLPLHSDRTIDARQDNGRSLRASGQFPSSVSKVQKMLAKITTQWSVASGSSKRDSKRGLRFPSRGLAARLQAPRASSDHQLGSKRGEMGRLVKEIHQMVRKLHQETGEQNNKKQNPFSQQASSTFEDKVSKSTSASKRGVEAVYHDPVEEKIDEILAMIR